MFVYLKKSKEPLCHLFLTPDHMPLPSTLLIVCFQSYGVAGTSPRAWTGHLAWLVWGRWGGGGGEEGRGLVHCEHCFTLHLLLAPCRFERQCRNLAAPTFVNSDGAKWGAISLTVLKPLPSFAKIVCICRPPAAICPQSRKRMETSITAC